MMKDLTEEQRRALAEMTAPDRFSTGDSNRELHRFDFSHHRGVPPAGVIWPLSTEEVSRILTWCYAQKVAVFPWGAGTSIEGNPVPTCPGLVMDLTRMDRVLAIRPEDLQADVQPGVLRRSLNREAGRHGLFFPPDPGADATIGGMIANNASGVRTVKYGATRDYVLRLTVVLPRGDVIHTGCRAPKSSSGYDLTRLFVGSEGTLGVVTEATLRLTGIPAHHLSAVVTFRELHDASKAVAMLIASGLDPAALELLPANLIALINREKGLGLPEMPSLFCEFHGVSPAALEETAALAKEVCEDCGATDFKSGVSAAERQRLWQARHEAAETILRAHPGDKSLTVDAAVPISLYPEMILFAQQVVAEEGVVGYVFGHAGDGNLHVVMPGNPEDTETWSHVEAVNERIVKRAVDLGGTCTGEHGIGIGKRRFMRREHGDSYDLMRRIKELMDPKNLMNPGKMF